MFLPRTMRTGLELRASTAVMTASVITELQQQFELLLNGGAPAPQEVEDEDDTEEADVDTEGGIGGYNFG